MTALNIRSAALIIIADTAHTSVRWYCRAQSWPRLLAFPGEAYSLRQHWNCSLCIDLLQHVVTAICDSRIRHAEQTLRRCIFLFDLQSAQSLLMGQPAQCIRLPSAQTTDPALPADAGLVRPRSLQSPGYRAQGFVIF